MSVKHEAPRRVGITEVPGRVVVTLGRLVKGKRRVNDEGAAALKEILNRKRPTTFEDFVRPTETLARRIIEKHGGVEGGSIPPSTAGGTWSQQAGYLLPCHVEEASPLAYALDVLWLLLMARGYAAVADVDGAMRYAWMAGVHAQVMAPV